MKRYEKEMVTKEEKILHAIHCDKCSKNISKPEFEFYYEVTTHHSRWGSDSIDSYEYLDFCTFDCMMENLKSYYSDMEAADTTKYDIERIDL